MHIDDQNTPGKRLVMAGKRRGKATTLPDAPLARARVAGRLPTQLEILETRIALLELAMMTQVDRLELAIERIDVLNETIDLLDPIGDGLPDLPANDGPRKRQH